MCQALRREWLMLIQLAIKQCEEEGSDNNMAFGVQLLIFESWLHRSPPNSLWQTTLPLLAYQM